MRKIYEDGSMVMYNDDKGTVIGKYGNLVKRVMKAVGADVGQVLVRDGYLSYALAKRHHDKDGGYSIVIHGPYINPAKYDIGTVEKFYKSFLEICFIDTPENNELFDMMYPLSNASLYLKKSNKYGVLSNSVAELEMKLTLIGA